jgi:large subunit ribosomal protein L24
MIIKMHVKKGDTVTVISGKDKGKTGKVDRVMPKTRQVVVEGIALAKRHLRAAARGQSGRIVERPMPIDASNVRVTEAGEKPAKKAKKAAN